MSLVKSKFLIGYIILMAIICYLEYYNLTSLRYVFKPLICLSLIVYVITCLSHNKYSIILALIFSLLGDILLMWQSLFIFGLVAFLFAHISYIINFYKDYGAKLKTKVIPIVLSIIYVISYFLYIQAKLFALKIPVLVYMCVIATMFIGALLRKVDSGYSLVVSGALLFVLSDSVLALDKFVTPFNHASVTIMLSYMLAQLCIVLGLVKQHTKISKV